MAHRLTGQAQFNDLPFVNFSGYPTFFYMGRNNFIEKNLSWKNTLSGLNNYNWKKYETQYKRHS